MADEVVSFRASTSFAQPLYRSPEEASPVTEFDVDGKRHGPVSDLFVVGVVERVETGIGYAWPDGPQVEGQPSTRVTSDFNASEAWISSIHLMVQVEDSIYRDPRFNGLSAVQIGLSLLSPVDFDALREALTDKRVAAQLITNDKTAFDLEPDAFGVVDYGALLGFVSDDDLVAFPALDLSPYLGPQASNPTVPLADLLDPPELVSLTVVDGVFVGADQ